MTEKNRILHVITGLGMGGAEMMLYKLVGVHRDRFDAQVISLTDEGVIAERIRALGIPVHALGMSTSRPGPRALTRLAGRIREIQPDLVQTWMYHADLVGGLAAWLAGDLPLVWGIHNTTLDESATRARTRMVVRMNARLSGWLPDRIISCSQKALELHAGLGYAAQKMVVIPNGFNLDDFKPDPAARIWLRDSLGLPPDALIIGHVARYNPQKDYPTLLAAAAELQRSLAQGGSQGLPDVHFVLCGDGVSPQNPELTGMLAQHKLARYVHLLGRRSDVPRVMSAFDLGTLSSAYGEAFPNVIGEMMACEVPCVVTDVGDADVMVGASGRVVPVRDPRALADAWLAMLQLPQAQRTAIGREARTHIQKHFALDEVASRYAGVYTGLLTARRREQREAA